MVLSTNRALADWRQGVSAPVLVPTMGALHAGHGALIRQASRLARELSPSVGGGRGGAIVSIFVNPTQFNDPNDFQRYPRTLEADVELARANGATCIFAPAPDQVYPAGDVVPTPTLPKVATEPGLEDAHRPGHFAGVCQVVARLFDLVRPQAAVFGEKDWQQLQVISAMTAEQSRAVAIIPGETVREDDGLAMSSRNRFLSPEDRVRARAISRALREAAEEPTPRDAEARMQRVLRESAIEPEYAVVRDAQTLGTLGGVPQRTPCRALIAARVGAVRLIDNAPWAAHT